MTEQWRPIPRYAGLYEVSDLGRVRGIDRVVIRSNGNPKTIPGTLRTQSIRKNGYASVTLSDHGKKRAELVHRLVLEAFVGPAQDSEEACHGDGDRSNNALTNLRWDTRSANHLDRRLHGTSRPWNSGLRFCQRGHEFTAANTRIGAEGRRICRACQRLHAAKFRAKKKGTQS